MKADSIINSGILELYAAGKTTPEENRQVQKWLDEYPEVEDELNAIQTNLEAYAQSKGVKPSPVIRTKVMEGIESNYEPVLTGNDITGDVQTPRVLHLWRRYAAAIVITLAGSLVMNVVLYTWYSDADDKLKDADSHLKQAESQLAAIQSNLSGMEAEMKVMKDPNAVSVSLMPMPVANGAHVKIFWMQYSGEVYVDAAQLPDPPRGKQFQLWAIVDGKPVDGGMINMSSGSVKKQIQKMKIIGKAEAFAITLEDATGSQSPSGPMYVMGKT